MGSTENLSGLGGAVWKLDSASRAGIYCLCGCRRMHKGCLQSHSSEWRKGAQEGHCSYCVLEASSVQYKCLQNFFTKNLVPLAFTSLGSTK